MQLRAVVADPRGAVIAGRAAAYGLCLSLTLIRGNIGDHVLVLALLLIIAVAASVATGRWPVVWAPYIEAAAAASVTAYMAADDPIGLPYLLAPALEAGLLWGFPPVVTTVGIAAFALTMAPMVSPEALDPRAYATLAAQWLVLALGAGSVAAWVRRVRLSASSWRRR